MAVIGVPKTTSVPTAHMTDTFSVQSTTHVVALLSTGVPPQRALMSTREWRRREQRQQRQPKPKTTATAPKGFA